jgi:hypothetical protein
MENLENIKPIKKVGRPIGTIKRNDKTKKELTREYYLRYLEKKNNGNPIEIKKIGRPIKIDRNKNYWKTNLNQVTYRKARLECEYCGSPINLINKNRHQNTVKCKNSKRNLDKLKYKIISATQ